MNRKSQAIATAKTLLWAVSLICLVGQTGQLTAQETATQPKVEVEDNGFQADLHLESFDVVWNTVKKSHWDPDVVGEKWDQAYEEFLPKAEAAKSAAEVRGVIEEMLGTLEMSHFGIIAKESYDEDEDDEEGGVGDRADSDKDDSDKGDSDEADSDEGDEDEDAGDGTSGLEVRLVEKKLVVTRVFDDSPAAAAGIQPGWIVKLIGKKTTDELIKASKKVGEHSVLRQDTAVGLVCDSQCSGLAGEKIPFAFIDNNGDVQLEFLELAEARGEPETFGNLPTFNVYFDSKVLDEEIGYIAFNSFIGGPRLNREYQKAIKEYQDKKGLVIDLRGNRGGLVILVAAMCGWLTDEKEPIGKMSMTGGNSMSLILNPRKGRYTKPVAVLTDECSISAAEIMAGAIKDLNLGRVFGSTTAGLSLPSTVMKLPNGDGFQYAISAYHTASGESIEGIGVLPDEQIVLTRELLSETKDPVLSAAKKWILDQGKE